MYRLLTALVGCTLASTGFCYEANDDFVDCLEVLSERERLSCYDGFARAAPVATEPRVVEAEPASAAAVIPESQPEPTTSRRPLRKVSPPPAPARSAMIVRIDELPNNRYQLTLSDGEIWQEIEGSSFRRYKVGAEVMIKRGAFGSHTLVADGARAKVRRALGKVSPPPAPAGSATIVRIDELPNNRYQLTLSDGAIWREIEGSSFRRYKVGTEVTIKRGAFGSRTLVADGARAKVARIDP